MDISNLTKVTSVVINESSETDYSFLDINLTPESLNGSRNRGVNPVNKNLTTCRLTYENLEDYNTKLTFAESNLNNVVVDLNTQSNNFELRDVTVEDLTINLITDGRLSTLKLNNVTAKTIKVFQTISHIESENSSDNEVNLIFENRNLIDEITFESEALQLENQLRIAMRGRDYTETTLNTLRMKNVIFKGADSYYESKEESPVIE